MTTFARRHSNGQKSDTIISFRVTPAELSAIQAKAKTVGLSIGQFVRDVLTRKENEHGRA